MLIPPASITGTVTDQSGNTMGGLEVVLFRASEYPAQAAQRTTTGPNGSYSFADVDAPQAYVLEVRSTTLGAIGSATLVLNASQAAVLNITVGNAPAAGTVPSTRTVHHARPLQPSQSRRGPSIPQPVPRP